jgi:hypothetical protein
LEGETRLAVFDSIEVFNNRPAPSAVGRGHKLVGRTDVVGEARMGQALSA